MDRALAAIQEVEALQVQMKGVLDLLKNLSERLMALETASKAAA